MQPDRKRLPTDSPRKVQTEMTAFTGKRSDNKSTPNRSYAQATSNNRFEALSDPEDEDEIMADASSDSSDITPNTANTKTTVTADGSKEGCPSPLSRKEQRKLAKGDKKKATNQEVHLSKEANAALEKARKAKATLQKDSGNKPPPNEVANVEDTSGNSGKSTFDEEQQASVKATPKNVETTSQTVTSGTTDTSNLNTVSSIQKEIPAQKQQHNPYQSSKSKYPSKSSPSAGSVDKPISLKRGMLRTHIHRYTLRIKIISSKSEEEEQHLVQKTLQKFFDIVLQGDTKTIIPPYFELDRQDNSVADLSSTYNVKALDSYYSLKRYFSRLSPRSAEGFVWSSVILAQSIPFSTFMEKTRHSLENQAFSLWPKASDHELATDLGWFLYSTRQQDEDRIAEMLSSLTGEKIGAKWKPIRTTDGANRAKDKDKDNSGTRISALHLECASDRAQAIRQKLAKWYGSSSKMFPDGTKMRLVPPFNTILSTGNRQKYASLITRQSALNSRLGTCSSWEMSTNLLLDRPHPKTGLSFRQLMLSIPSLVFPGTPLFHTIDKQWRSESTVVFTFLPENESDARSLVAGLIPFLNDTVDSWYLNMFTPEAKIRHADSKWDHTTRQVFSADEFVVEEFLADDDEYNKSDEPTTEKPQRKVISDESNIEVNIPIVIDPEDFPKMYQDDDSVSTFHKAESSAKSPLAPSTKFNPVIVSNTPSLRESSTSTNKPSNVSYYEDGESISKLSDTQSRISTLEHDIKLLNSSFQNAFAEMKLQTQQQASQQKQHDDTLAEILALLKQKPKIAMESDLSPAAQDNPPKQSTGTGGSQGAAGPG